MLDTITMDIFSTIFLSLLEGITEFLPISSTGHLILAAKFLHLPDSQFLTTFEIAIQAAAIAAVAVLYVQKVRHNPRLLATATVAFIPAGILGLTLYSLIKDVLLSSPLVVIFAMGIGGIALVAVEKYVHDHKAQITSLDKISYSKAFIIGLFQSLSLIPGTSRSAATIVGGLLTKLDRKTAVEFSFLTALPTIGAAAALDLVKSRDTLTSTNLTTLIIGFFIAFIVAYFTMKYFLKYLDSNTLKYFGIYRIALAIISFLILFS